MEFIRKTIEIALIFFLVSCHQESETIEYVFEEKRITAQINRAQIVDKYDSGAIEALQFKQTNNSNYFIGLYENGLKKKEGLLVNQKEEGLWKYYYSNGRPGSCITYKQGRIDGRVFEIDSIGAVRFVGNQKMGKLEGFTTYFFEDGTIRKQGIYKAGKQIGDWIRNE